MKHQTVRELLGKAGPRVTEEPREDNREAVRPHLPVRTGHTREAYLLLDASAAGRWLRLPRPGHARDATAPVTDEPAATPPTAASSFMSTLCPGSQRDQLRSGILAGRRGLVCAPI